MFTARTYERIGRLAVGAAVAVCIIALIYLDGLMQQHDWERFKVHEYCTYYQISTAEERGCEAHVTAARVDALANRGDAAAIWAEKQVDAADGAQQ